MYSRHLNEWNFNDAFGDDFFGLEKFMHLRKLFSAFSNGKIGKNGYSHILFFKSKSTHAADAFQFLFNMELK